MMTLLLLALLAFLLLSLFRQTERQIEETNQQIERSMGDAYNPDLAGQPRRDGCGLIIITMGLTVLVVLFLASIFPPP